MWVSLASFDKGRVRLRTLAGLQDLSLSRESFNVPEEQHTGRAPSRSLKPRTEHPFSLRVRLADDVEAVDLRTNHKSTLRQSDDKSG